MFHYSLCKATIGSNRAALRAGYKPNKKPIPTEINKAMAAPCKGKLTSHPIPILAIMKPIPKVNKKANIIPTIPPILVKRADSIKN